MQVPLYFINNNEIDEIIKIINAYIDISSNSGEILTEKEVLLILDKLKKRVLLTNLEFLKLTTLLSLVVISSETLYNLHNIDLIMAKYILIKLFALHRDNLTDDDMVENFRMFRYIYKSLEKSKDILSLNSIEEDAYNYLFLLQI